MRLFRSEEEIDEWCRAHERPRGATLDVPTLQALAARWYGDRLDPAWRPRGAEESQRILGAHGLTGQFWRLTSSSASPG
jgi:hypothetical protein